MGARRTAIAFGLGLLLASSSTWAGPRVYGESLMVKVRPDTPPRDAARVQLLAARNEAVSFQVVISGGDTGATSVSARFDHLDGPGRIERGQITLYRVEFLNVVRPSDGSGGAGPWPDALVPDVDEVAGEPRNAFPFDVPRGESRSIWVDVLVPEDAQPGHYRGEVKVDGAGGFTASVSAELEVVDATLPSTPSYPTSFGIDERLVCEAHTSRSDCGTEAVMVELLKRYARLALDHRFTLADALVLQSHGAPWDRFDTEYGPLLEGTAPTRLRGARMTSAQYLGPVDANAVTDFVAHFKARGWLSRVFDYTADEPGIFSSFDDVRARANLLESAAPELVRMVTTDLDTARANGVDGLIDRMSVLIQKVPEFRDFGPWRANYDAYLAQPGNSLWLYQSCTSHSCRTGGASPAHWPSYMVDHPPTVNRAMPWVVFLQQGSGETYYQTAARLPTAWTDQEFYGGNGDGTLFYPGTPALIGGRSDVPLPSLRLKLLRAGVQDYEWLNRVSRAGDRGFAEQVARELMPSPYGVTLDAAAFERARERLIRRALELPDPDVERPRSTVKASSSSGCGCFGGAHGVMMTLLGLGIVRALRNQRQRVG